MLKSTGGKYCLMVAIPPSAHKAADLTLGTVLIGGGLASDLTNWVNWINPWVAFAGGFLGVIIASFRVYELASSFLRRWRKK